MSEAPSIDLLSFCAGDGEFREWLKTPFCVGDFTYATDGHLLVRLPRDARYPNCDKVDPAKFMGACEAAAYSRPGAVTLPPLPEKQRVECLACKGRGKEHDCPDCDCECVVCDGAGFVDHEHRTSTDFAGGIFNLKYLRQLLGIPDVEIAVGSSDQEKNRPLLFRFPGGYGALMPCRRPFQQHVKIESEPSLPAHG